MRRPVSLWTQIAKTQAQAAAEPEHAMPAATPATATEQPQHPNNSTEGLRIGDFFVDAGRLSGADVDAIVEKQRAGNLRFGDAAMALGLLREDEVQQALSKQYQYPIASADAALAGFPIAYAPHTPEAEAIRKIRTQLLLKLDANKTQSIAIISPNSGEGKSYVATSLALAFAQNGQRTLLINANLREAQHSGVLDSQRLQGLSSVLSKRHTLAQCLMTTSFAKLCLLDAGPLPPNPAELLLAPGLKNIFENIGDQFDVVILDTPSMNLFPDAQLIAQQVNACLIVARQHTTPVGDIRKTKRMIHAAGGMIVGSIFNEYPDPDTNNSSRHGLTKQLFQWRNQLLSRFR